MLIFDDVTDGSRSQQPHSLTDWSVEIFPPNKIKKYFLKVCLKSGNFYGFWGKHDLFSSLYKEADGIEFKLYRPTTLGKCSECSFYHSLKGLQMTFPIDNSFSGCYKDRQSCLDRDLPAEVLEMRWASVWPIIFWYFSQIDHLAANLLNFRGLLTDWIGFSETISNIIQEKEF